MAKNWTWNQKHHPPPCFANSGYIDRQQIQKKLQLLTCRVKNQQMTLENSKFILLGPYIFLYISLYFRKNSVNGNGLTFWTLRFLYVFPLAINTQNLGWSNQVMPRLTFYTKNLLVSNKKYLDYNSLSNINELWTSACGNYWKQFV